MSISDSLHRAAQLQEKIDALREQLSTVLDQARLEMGSASEGPVGPLRGKGPGRRKVRRGPVKARAIGKPASVAVRRGRPPKKLDGRSKAARALRAASRSPLAGRKRSSSPSGPLAPAVVKVLGSKSAMSVKTILEKLVASGYKFNTPEPKKNLAARIYRLKGVKKVSEGLFAAA